MEYTIEYHNWQECCYLQQILIHLKCKWSNKNNKWDLNKEGIRLNLPESGILTVNSDGYLYLSNSVEARHKFGFFRMEKEETKGTPVKLDDNLYVLTLYRKHQNVIPILFVQLMNAGYNVLSTLPTEYKRDGIAYLILRKTRTISASVINAEEFAKLDQNKVVNISYGIYNKDKFNSVEFFNSRSSL